MRTNISRIAAIFFSAFAWVALAAAADTQPLPEWSKIQTECNKHFAGLKNHQNEDLISRSDIEPLIERLQKLGWKSLDKSVVLQKLLDDGSPLVREFRTSAGTAYMRKISSVSGAYDRFDRLTQLAGGPKLLHTIVGLPDGATYAQAKPTPGIKNIAQMLPKQSNAAPPSDPNFDKPTGKLYTTGQLQQYLQQLYDASKKSKGKV